MATSTGPQPAEARLSRLKLYRITAVFPTTTNMSYSNITQSPYNLPYHSNYFVVSASSINKSNNASYQLAINGDPFVGMQQGNVLRLKVSDGNLDIYGGQSVDICVGCFD